MNYVGIDISKESFDVAFVQDGRYQHYKFPNDANGFKSLVKAINKDDSWAVMEASGPYYLRLACYLEDAGVPLSVVNPLVIRRFCQMRLARTKTDKKDAVMIAEYGKTEKPAAWKGEEDYMLELRQMQALISQLEKSKAGVSRQLEAFNQSPVTSKIVKAKAKSFLLKVEKDIKALELQMEALVEQYHPEVYKQVKSVPGIGKKTGMLLVVISNGFTKFGSSKQLSSYIGLSPRIFESGTSVKGRARICKMGMSKIRAMLYVCTWSAVKCNKPCKELYERMVAKGKPKMVALIAVANKLLKQVFAVATKSQLYNENYLPKACF